MSDLPGFLLARYAEERVGARAWERAYNDPGPAPALHYATMRRHRAEWPTLWRSLDQHTPAAVLAHLTALRAVVSALTAWDPDPTRHPSVEAPEHDAWRMLTYLAAPYANYPDFDPAWRP